MPPRTTPAGGLQIAAWSISVFHADAGADIAVLMNSLPLSPSMRERVAETLTRDDGVAVVKRRGAEIDVDGRFADEGRVHLMTATLRLRGGQHELLSVHVLLAEDAEQNWRWDLPGHLQDDAPPDMSLGAGSWPGGAGVAHVDGVPNTGHFPPPTIASDTAMRSSGLAPWMWKGDEQLNGFLASEPLGSGSPVEPDWWNSQAPAVVDVEMGRPEPSLNHWADPFEQAPQHGHFVSLEQIAPRKSESHVAAANVRAVPAGIPIAGDVAPSPANCEKNLLAHGYRIDQVRALSWGQRNVLSARCQQLLAKGFTHGDLLQVTHRNAPLLHELAACIADWQERFPTADPTLFAPLLSGVAKSTNNIRERHRQAFVFHELRKLPNAVNALTTPEQLCTVAELGKVAGLKGFGSHFETLTEQHGYDAAQVTAVAANYLGDKALAALAQLHDELSAAPLHLTRQQLVFVAAKTGGGSALDALAQYGPRLAGTCSIEQIIRAAAGEEADYKQRDFASGRKGLEELYARYS
jgi:hypothetical protein